VALWEVTWPSTVLPCTREEVGRAAARMGPLADVGGSILEKVDCAELGRSGKPFNAALRWAAMASRTEGRVVAPGLALTLPMLDTEEDSAGLLGL